VVSAGDFFVFAIPFEVEAAQIDQLPVLGKSGQIERIKLATMPMMAPCRVAR
jgi:hypothetical protein